MPATKVYKVQGMHCPSCALLIEGKLTTCENVIAAFVNLNQKILTVQYRENPFTPQELNALFQEEGYTFSDSSLPLRPKDSLLSIAIAALFVGLFLFWQKVPWSKSLGMHSQPSLWALFLFGAIAGTSNCAALVGSLTIALAREWAEKSHERKANLLHQLLFHSGRLLVFFAFGGLLGAVGNLLALSQSFFTIVATVVSIGLFFSGLHMMGVTNVFSPFAFFSKIPILRTVQASKVPSLPASFLKGVATVILPCGFTMTAQSVALMSANALRGSLIMGVFALGTFPALWIIGFSSTTVFRHPRLSRIALKAAGIMVIFLPSSPFMPSSTCGGSKAQATQYLLPSSLLEKRLHWLFSKGTSRSLPWKHLLFDTSLTLSKSK